MTTVRAAPMLTTTGTKGFMEWLKKKHPLIYKRASPQLAQKIHALGGLGLSVSTDVVSASPTGSTSSTLASNIKDIVMAASQFYLTREQMQAQEKVLDIQLRRTQQGLAPLDIDLAQFGVTGPSVDVGIAPGTQTMLLWAAAIIAGILIVPRLLRR